MSLTRYRTLGRSGLVVSPLALGTMTFGPGPWGADAAASRAMVEYEYTIEPRKERHITYRNMLFRYREATEAITPTLHALCASGGKFS